MADKSGDPDNKPITVPKKASRAGEQGKDLPTVLLARLPKLTLPQKMEGGQNDIRFEHYALIAAGITQQREMELLHQLVGDKRWEETQATAESVPESDKE